MDKNHTSNSSMCKKIRAAIATSPAFRAIYRVSSYHHHQESRPNSNSPPPSQTKHPKGYSAEGAGAGIIPIKFEYSTPTSHVAAKVEPEPPYISMQRKPPAKAAPLEAHHGHGKNFESAFTEYLEHNKQKITNVLKASGGQSKAAPDEGHGTKKNDNHKDHFTDFIERAKKKIRTTSNIGKANSLKRG